MNLEFFLANRIVFPWRKTASEQNGDFRFSSLASWIAIGSIALGTAVMEISFSIMNGFHHEIENKIGGFVGHIQIGNYISHTNREPAPLAMDEKFLNELKHNPEIANASPFIIQTVLLQSKEGVEGVIAKGADKNYNWKFLQEHLISGKIIRQLTDDSTSLHEILISKKLADKLLLQTRDKAQLFVATEPPRARAVHIAGIYETGMQGFDDVFILGDIKLLQEMKTWQPNMVNGYEILLKDSDKLQIVNKQLSHDAPYNVKSSTFKELYPQIFDWLNLQHKNVRLVIVLMIIVSCINMASALLIMILERTRMIGILKALGMSGWRVHKIFLWKVFFLILIGLIAGNLLGFSLGAVQQHFGWMKLNVEAYYVNVIPIQILPQDFLFVNFLSLATCMIAMLLPVLIINRLDILSVFRFSR